jgi:hypothetical protein
VPITQDRDGIACGIVEINTVIAAATLLARAETASSADLYFACLMLSEQHGLGQLDPGTPVTMARHT